MFFAGRYGVIRNIVLAGFVELFHFHTSATLFRQFGTFSNSQQFMAGLNGKLTDKVARALYGTEKRAFAILSHTPERQEAERALLQESIRNVMATWCRFAEAIGARLTVVMQPTPELQVRERSPEEAELLANYDTVSGMREVMDRCFRDHRDWHGAEMAALADELGFTWLDINARLDRRFDGEWLHVDPVHMVDQGYLRAAEQIVPVLS
jgi:hypothetical protein